MQLSFISTRPLVLLIVVSPPPPSFNPNSLGEWGSARGGDYVEQAG